MKEYTRKRGGDTGFKIIKIENIKLLKKILKKYFLLEGA